MKLDQEDFKKLQTLRDQHNLVVNELGQISLLEINLETRKQQARDYLTQLKKSESIVAKELEDKYGKGQINTDTGEFIPG